MPEFVVEFGRKVEAGDDRLDAAAYHRNFAPMLAVLETLLAGRSGDVLEIGSGTGQHVAGFARALPALTWWPTDPNANHLRSIAAWTRHSGLANVSAPLPLDAADPDPGAGLPDRFAAIVSMNVLHIAPWTVAEGILGLARQRLADDGILALYGPFHRDGAPTSPGNAAFDASLRAENPAWGVRDVEAVADAARAAGLRLDDIVQMPANNLTLILRRA
jgi:SAM-dependent methyltransferase